MDAGLSRDKITEQAILCDRQEDNKPPAIPPINEVEPSIKDSIFTL